MQELWSEITAHDGTIIADATLQIWFDDAEAGNLPGEPGPVRIGWPLAIGAEPVRGRLGDGQEACGRSGGADR